MDEGLYIIKAKEVEKILNGKEKEIVDLVGKTYVLHNEGMSSLPHSIFLRFPNKASDRIIGLPAYIGGDLEIAGMKWISSFPENIEHNMERASAVTILNDMETGRANAILEGSIISAKRTAASAALAAKTLHGNQNETNVGVVGCGRINKDILDFIDALFPNIEKVFLFDQFKERAEAFRGKFSDKTFEIIIVSTVDEVFENAKLISFATTAGTPYINELNNSCGPDSTILNISLRDFAPEVVEQCDNIVDDLDHVCREKTSIHLTEQKLNTRQFVRGTLADVLSGKIENRVLGQPVMFSPFGLGVLDLALANLVKNEVIKNGMGTFIEDFLI
jgi:N-[(2S)-2-amino-2-carboxyethyl]-L-glutamate dehydrogenase